MMEAFRKTLLAIAALAIAGGLFLYGDLLMNRVAQDGVIDGGRKAVWPMIWNAILANPWLGYGYGAFADAFPMVRDGSLDIRYVWDKAHNSWLETLHGLGIPAGLAFIFLYLGNCVENPARRAGTAQGYRSAGRSCSKRCTDREPRMRGFFIAVASYYPAFCRIARGRAGAILLVQPGHGRPVIGTMTVAGRYWR